MSYKVVYNACYGGFSISRKAQEYLGLPVDEYGCNCPLDRHDPKLVEMVEKLGDEAGGMCADLQIATISGNKYRIDEYDGNESVIEPNDGEWTVIE